MRPPSASKLALLAASLFATAAFAAGAPEADVALAETLFREAKQKMAANDFAAACPMLAESQRLDPGGGTLLTLALCHESEGRTASAWTELEDALAMARRDGNAARSNVAEKHLRALEPTLSHLRVTVSPAAAAIPGLAVTRDDAPLARPSWGLDAPVDPGTHTVRATAPGRSPWTITIDVGKAADRKEIVVLDLALEPEAPSPSLSAAPPASSAPAAPAGPTPPSSTLRIGGLTALGIAGGAAVVGGYFGLKAISEHHDARATCPTVSCADEGAVNLDRTSKRHADVATVAFAISVVLGGTAATMLLWPADVSVQAGPTSAGMAWRGRF